MIADRSGSASSNIHSRLWAGAARELCEAALRWTGFAGFAAGRVAVR
jgi:hypothetical protein